MIISWLSIKSHEPNITSQKLRLSVIVPFRNEKDNIKKLVESLCNQSYSHELFEVILVNDHSTDSFELQNLPVNFSLHHVSADKSGKKEALSYGISIAKGEIIITTDADCSFSAQWLEYLVNSFNDPNIKLVFGGVRFQQSASLFDQLQMIEFAPVIGVGAASNYLGKSIMCNGANLAFRKSTFLEVQGYSGNEHIPTGDDEYLLHKIVKLYPKGIKYEKSKACVVTTVPAQDLNQFFQQRKRWASKWSANHSYYKSSIALLVFCSVISTIVVALLLISNPSGILITLLVLKILFDGIFIKSVLKSFNCSFHPAVFILAQLLYPFYVLIIGIAANFGSYSWKGRRF